MAVTDDAGRSALRNGAAPLGLLGSIDVSDSQSMWPAVRVPPRVFEYWYFATVFYGIFGSALGLSAGLVGAAMVALLAVGCVLRMGSLAILLPVALPLAFGASYLVVQIVAFGEPIMDPDIRSVVAWILGVVVIQCLALRRGFLHRFAIAMFLMGLCTLPYLTLYKGSDRYGLSSGVVIANPNDLGAWFGFSCLYFAVMALETRRMSVRLVSAAAAIGCLSVCALTVSRAPLFAGAVGLAVASRRVLKRGFFPFLALVIVAWLVYAFGLFDRSASLYATRGLEESGRFAVWPLAIKRFLDSPLIGVGAWYVATWVPEGNGYVTPHNEFIFIALASGALPLLFFIAYRLQLGAAVLRLNAQSHEDAVFLVPLFLYVFLIGLELAEPYVMPWAMVTVGTVSASGFLLKVKAKGSVAGRIGVPQGARRRNRAIESVRTRA